MESHQWIDSFWSSAYAPHGYCLLWRRDLVATHLISDILIAAAYFSIPFALVRLVRPHGEPRHEAFPVAPGQPAATGRSDERGTRRSETPAPIRPEHADGPGHLGSPLDSFHLNAMIAYN